VHQSRQLSLFGWGSSTATSPSEQSLPHSGPSTTAQPTQNLDALTSSPVQSSLGPGRSVKASHATSDTAESSLLNPISPGDHEPAFLKNFENSLSSGQGETPDVDIASIPERVGYLKEVCGVDFGWGTTSMIQWVVENLHIYSGMTWSLSIVVTCLVARVLIFPSAIKGQAAAAKLKAIQPVLGPLRTQYNEATKSGDKVQIQVLGSQIRGVMRDSDVSMLDAFKPVLFQLPLTFGLFKLGRAMSALPVPALENESFLWLYNVALVDPWLLPGFCGALAYITLAGAPQTGATGTMSEVAKVLKYVLPPVSVLFLHWQPGLVQIFLATQAAASFVQVKLFNNPHSRAWFNLPPHDAPIPPKPSSPSPAPNFVKGMRLSSPSSNSVILPKESKSDVSVIDRVVDKVKQQKDSATSHWKSLSGDRIKERQQAKAQENVDKYEFKRRQDAEMERKWRNDNLRNKK
jgi:YidC/Oxa1 family membrane protein insertase